MILSTPLSPSNIFFGQIKIDLDNSNQENNSKTSEEMSFGSSNPIKSSKEVDTFSQKTPSN